MVNFAKIQFVSSSNCSFKRHIMVKVLIHLTKISCIAYKSLELWIISHKELELYAWAKTKVWS